MVNVTNFGMKTLLNATPYIVITAFMKCFVAISGRNYLESYLFTCLEYSIIAPVTCARNPYDLEVVNMSLITGWNSFRNIAIK